MFKVKVVWLIFFFYKILSMSCFRVHICDFFYNKKKFRDFQNFLAHSSVFRENWYFFFCALSQLIIQKFYLIIHNKYFFLNFVRRLILNYQYNS